MPCCLNVPNAMLLKSFASWLVVLVILPFTAPFATCDLTGLFGDDHGHEAPVAIRSSVKWAPDPAVPTALFVSSVGRLRSTPPCRVPLAESATTSSSAPLMWSTVSAASCGREHAVFGTILRV